MSKILDVENLVISFRTSNGKVQAVRDLIRGIPEIKRHRDCPGFQNTEVDRQPFQAVEHQDRYTVTLL